MDSTSEINIETYIENNQIDEAIILIDEKFKSDELSEDEKIHLYLSKLRLLREKGYLDKASLIVDLLQNQDRYNLNDYQLVEFHTNLAYLMWWSGKYDESENLISRIYEIIDHKNLDSTSTIMRCKGTLAHLTGLNHTEYGNTIQSQNHLLDALELRNKYGNKIEIATTKITLGFAYYVQGSYERSLQYYEEAQDIFVRLNNAQGIGRSKFLAGIIYFVLGRLEIGEYLLKEAYSYSEDNDNDVFKSRVLLNLLRIEIEKNDTSDEFEGYYEKLQNIVGKNPGIPLIFFRFRFIEALRLRISPRLMDKVEAAKVFQTILKSSEIDLELRILTIKYNIEYLLDEYRLYGEEIVLLEIKELLQVMEKIGTKESATAILIQSLILQSKLSLVEGNLQNARKVLDKSLEIGKQSDNLNFGEEVLAEIDYLEKHIEEWQTMSRMNIHLYEKFEKARVMEYLKSTQDIIKGFRS